MPSGPRGSVVDEIVGDEFVEAVGLGGLISGA